MLEPILFLFPGSRTQSWDLYWIYNIWQDVEIRTRVAATAARYATNELLLHASLLELGLLRSFASDVLKVRSSLFRYIRSLKKSDSLQSLFFKEWIERKKREVWSSWDDVVWVTWSEWQHWLVYKAGSRDHTVAATGPWHYVYIFVFHFFGNFI